MTEKQIRQKVADTALSYLGVRAGSAKHTEILSIYNAQQPLPRGTRMQPDWLWCAAFVSAISLSLDLRDIMPTEMSCPKMVALYMALGRWEENDAYVPSPGDVIFYDWNDGNNYAATDDKGEPGHVGIVTACDGERITVVEGNVSNRVATRNLAVNGRYIRGFGLPDYASVSTPEGPDRVSALAEKIAAEIRESGLDAAAVLAAVQMLLTGADKPAQPEKPTEPEKPKEPSAEEIHALALAVIRGEYGNGATRRALLGDKYDKVQAEVNKILGG